ncbi:MAG: hypothetical protein EBZ47_04905 [Chlamydiae bacterium]|nr:hypothetical protein [Chlamydiota bacterium]
MSIQSFTPIKSNPLPSSGTPSEPTPVALEKIRRLSDVLHTTPSQPVRHNQGGECSIAKLINNDAATTVERCIRKRYCHGLTPESSNKKIRQELAHFAKDPASSVLSPFSINKIRQQIGDRRELTKSELALGQLSAASIHTIILNQIDQKLGSPKSYYVLDLDHIVGGEIHSKAGLSGKHVYPKDPSIIVEKEFRFNDHISTVSWRVPSINKSKISTCFSESVFGATDGQNDTEDLIKKKLLDAFACSMETSFKCVCLSGYRGIYEMGMNGDTIYLEVLKESPQTHLIRTLYPIVFFEDIPIADRNYLVKIASSICKDGALIQSGQPIYLPYSIFCSIFQRSLSEFLTNIPTPGNGPIRLKPPVRYYSSEKKSYILDGALGLQALKTDILSGILTDFFSEGFYAEFDENTVDRFLKQLKSSLTADQIMSLQPTKRTNFP